MYVIVPSNSAAQVYYPNLICRKEMKAWEVKESLLAPVIQLLISITKPMLSQTRLSLPPPPHDKLWLNLLTCPNSFQVLRCTCLCHLQILSIALLSALTQPPSSPSFHMADPTPSLSCTPPTSSHHSPTWYSLTTHNYVLTLNFFEGRNMPASPFHSEHLRQHLTQQITGIYWTNPWKGELVGHGLRGSFCLCFHVHQALAPLIARREKNFLSPRVIAPRLVPSVSQCSTLS